MSKIINLQYPIEFEKDGEKNTITEVKLGRLKAKHLKKLPKDFFNIDKGNISPDQVIPIISVISGIPLELVDELDITDLNTIAQEIASFL